jgi:hypothetical protein
MEIYFVASSSENYCKAITRQRRHGQEKGDTMKEPMMKNAGSFKRGIQTGLMGLVFASITLSAEAQQTVPAAEAAPQNPPAAVPFVENTPSTPQKPGTEGITIHGHWIMDVINRDGSIAVHRDFENALVPSQGGSVLTGLLLGTISPQTFDVVLKGTGKTAILYLNGQSCPQVLANFQGDCSATLTQDSLGGSTIVLKAMYTPTAALTVTTVSTNIGTCPTTAGGATPVSPATCQATTSGIIPGSGGAGVGIYGFTAATIPDLAIAADQILVVKVMISFS